LETSHEILSRGGFRILMMTQNGKKIGSWTSVETIQRRTYGIFIV
jgi:hypothetical protein